MRTRPAGRDVIYLAGHDFGLPDAKVSTDHLAEQLAGRCRVLYVESVGLRAPRLERRDLFRIGRKLARFLRPPRRVADGLWVVTPLAVPLHRLRWVRLLNRGLLLAQIRLAAALLRLRSPLLFVFLPHLGDLVGRLGESLSVYYCTDEHAAFHGVDTAAIAAAERELVRKADLGFATSPQLLAPRRAVNPHFHLSPHGVDVGNFGRALDPALPVPEEVRDLPRPVVGFFGAVERWLDLPLIGRLARARPGWTFLFIGRLAVDVAALSALPNVRFLGPRPYRDLPRYGRVFDAAIVPFLVDGLTAGVFPVKLKEYLAMGRPVVSTALPPVVDYAAAGGRVAVAADAGEFLALLERELAGDGPERVRERLESVRADTWEARAAEISRLVEERLTSKRTGAPPEPGAGRCAVRYTRGRDMRLRNRRQDEEPRA